MAQACSEKLLLKFQAGLSLSDIETVTGISTSALSRQLRALDQNYSKSTTWRPVRKEAFLLYIQGHSLRNLSRKLGFHYTTYHRWFRSMSPYYGAIAKQGVFASTGEFLSSKQARARPDEALKVRNWLLANLQELIESEGNTNTVTYSSAKEFRLGKSQTSRFSDFRNSL